MAAPIARCLSRNGFTVKRWWDIFRAGDLTLDRLIRICREVDGAVFIYKGTDKVWMRNTERDAARDNVIFELGMFVQQLGPSRCVVVKDSATHLPSDLDGLTYISLTEEDVTTTAEEVSAHFAEQFSSIPYDQVESEPQVFIVEMDPHIVGITSGGNIPSEWHVRALFFGTEGAQKWLAIEKHPDYLAHKAKTGMRKQLLSVVDRIKTDDNVQIPTFVSLGPGGAAADRELVIHLGPGHRAIKYV